MIAFKTSLLAASLFLTSHAWAQVSADLQKDSQATPQLRSTRRAVPDDDEATSNPTSSNARNSLPSSKGLPDWRVDLYPVFAWAPIFGATASIPDAPNPSPRPVSSGSVSSSFNGAAFAGFGIEKSKWSAAGNLLWAGLSGQRQTPFVRIDTNFIYGQFMLGREVLPHLFAEAGFRRTAIKIAATVSTLPQVTWKPGVWDPLVGLTYRRPLGHRWQFRIHGDGGGFGVGNDASISSTASTEWHFARHFELLFGYGFLYFRDSRAIAGQPTKIKETLHGPMFGFGLHFGRAEDRAQGS